MDKISFENTLLHIAIVMPFNTWKNWVYLIYGKYIVSNDRSENFDQTLCDKLL